MKLEDIATKAMDFGRKNADPYPKLCYIKNIGEVWSCVYETSLSKVEPLFAVLLRTEDGEIVGFRRLKAFEE